MGVHWRQIAGFVEGIRTVREEFVKEDPVWAGICQRYGMMAVENRWQKKQWGDPKTVRIVCLTLKAGCLVHRLHCVELEGLAEPVTVLRVLTNTQLDVLAEGLIELVKIILVLGDLNEQVEAFLGGVFADDVEGLVRL